MDETGEFGKKTYKSLVKLVAWLESVYGLDEEHVIRLMTLRRKSVLNILLIMKMSGSCLKKKLEITE